MSEIADLTFVVRQERIDALSFDGLCTLEGILYGEFQRATALRPVYAHFLVDDKGNYQDSPAALKRIGAVSVKDLRALADRFGAALRDALIPPPNAGA
jgi:hypothetical protein